MRVFTITFQWALNYGAVLQTLALQTVLKRRTDFAYVLPVVPDTPRCLFRRIIGKSLGKTILKIRLLRLEYKFSLFRNKYFDYGGTSRLSYTSIKKGVPVADCYIAGSDQVWNPNVTTYEEQNIYFLSVCPIHAKRVSYAASFGTTALTEQQSDFLFPFLSQFHSISVREESGCDILSKMGLSGLWMPDPTLLLSAQDWTRLLGVSLGGGGYIFHYQLPWESELDCQVIAHQFSICSGLKVISPYPFVGGNLFRTEFDSPPEWVKHIGSASYIVTNSFHCVVFALLFHVPFSVILISGSLSGMNERVLDLLGKLNLSNRIVSLDSDPFVHFGLAIDWTNIDKKIEAWRLNAIDFIDRAVFD